jgi:predicted RNA-binding protein with PUA domain
MLLRDRDGRLKMVTYWCDICSIRTYIPGPCMCCQKYTDLDLRMPDDIR